MADATPEPRAELVQRARELTNALRGGNVEFAEVFERRVRTVVAVLAAVEREAGRRAQDEAAETLQREIGVAWHDAEAALARRVREILESFQVVPSRLEAEERADRKYRNAVGLASVPNLEQRTRRAVLAILKLLDPKEPGDAET